MTEIVFDNALHLDRDGGDYVILVDGRKGTYVYKQCQTWTEAVEYFPFARGPAVILKIFRLAASEVLSTNAVKSEKDAT